MAHRSSEWDVSRSDAVRRQEALAPLIVRRRTFGQVNLVAGIDAHYFNGSVRAVVAALSYPNLQLVSWSMAVEAVEFPYIPGFLAFREGPAIMRALLQLRCRPDLLIFDGQGIAHPRRLGIASHIGLLVDIPSIGCAKRRLCGDFKAPAEHRGHFSLLRQRGECIGAAVRTRQGVKPLFVSIGHRTDLLTSIAFVVNCCRGFRLPETTRWANRLAAAPANLAKPQINRNMTA